MYRTLSSASGAADPFALNCVFWNFLITHDENPPFAEYECWTCYAVSLKAIF